MLNKISKILNSIDPAHVDALIGSLVQAKEDGKKILIVGVGRSGLVGRAFAMRLMHLGFNVYIVGETITPAFREGDLVIIISGSGTSSIPVAVVNMSKELKTEVIALTSYPESPVGKMANKIVEISGRRVVLGGEEYYARQLTGIHTPLDPMGSIFENACMIFLDSVITELTNRLKINRT
ncbi:MAG: SIS domain-containing protein [Candidatus Bathyarchaeia archaeon]